MCNCIGDLLDQTPAVRGKIWRMEQDLKQLKEEKERLEASGQRSGLVVPSSVSGLLKDALAETRAPKKKKKSNKRHPGLSSEERQEYYKS